MDAFGTHQGGDNLVKGVQCYELFGGIALKNHAFSFFSFVVPLQRRAHSSSFRSKRRRSTWPFYRQDTYMLESSGLDRSDQMD